MKHVMKYFLLLCFCGIIISCNEKAEDIKPVDDDGSEHIEREPLDFQAEIEQGATFKVGDTVVFILAGNAHMVSFYAGTFGNAYDYHDQDRFYDVMPMLSFESAKSAGNNPDCATLYYSDEFDGNYTYENVKSVNWKPITDRFELSPLPEEAGLINTFSGEVNISDTFSSDTPIYFAWHCTTDAASQRTQFRVQNFTLRGVVEDNPSLSSTLYTQVATGFQWLLNDAAASQGSNLPSVSSTQLLWNGIFNNLSGTYKEGYAVSVPLELPQFNAGKDKPTVLLPMNDNTWSNHTFVYDKPGEYEVVFIGAYLDAGDQPEIIKKLTVKIEE
ncbi:DUF5017 domain-containing protein [Sphingobacterium phlebotomi]|uniref:DUF5017 domain-containing protein n=1 Tax=Sphingobacterium phlebotomi TaxID=2605433 RepID=A0A5D4H8Q2_9SPHI|nr:DUF5017 domain-containing protein [Sphingobacterium phlebotomi]TYR37531.1 DUF5017 domain-containing protein [Sphingobacterium phlebotomi]